MVWLKGPALHTIWVWASRWRNRWRSPATGTETKGSAATEKRQLTAPKINSNTSITVMPMTKRWTTSKAKKRSVTSFRHPIRGKTTSPSTTTSQVRKNQKGKWKYAKMRMKIKSPKIKSRLRKRRIKSAMSNQRVQVLSKTRRKTLKCIKRTTSSTIKKVCAHSKVKALLHKRAPMLLMTTNMSNNPISKSPKR